MAAKTNDVDPNAIIQADILSALALQQSLEAKVQAIQTAQKRIDDIWKAVEKAMITHNVKSIKGSFGSVTIAERTTFKVEDIDDLPDDYKKLAPDAKKIGNYYALTGDALPGTVPVVTKYITKRLKP